MTESEAVDALYTLENGTDSVKPFMQELRPGDRLRWSGRKTPVEVLFVDYDGSRVGASMDHWTNLESALLRGQRGGHFRLCVLNSGTTLRLYRLTSSSWEYGTDSMGSPDEFFVTDRLDEPVDATEVGKLSRGDRIIDSLNPGRYSFVVDPSDAFGQIVVEPWQAEADDPYPKIEQQTYVVKPDEITGWGKSGFTPTFDV